MSKAVDTANRVLGAMYLKGGFTRAFANAMYDSACWAYKMKNVPTDAELDHIIDEFRPNATQEQRAFYRKELKRCWKKYGHAPDEYFLYDLEHCDEERKGAFISDVDRLKFASILNDRAASRIFNHKLQTYAAYKEFYKREVVSPAAVDEAFLQRHPKFVFKRENASRGVGVRLVDSTKYASLEQMKQSIEGWDEGICEELIVADPRMAAFHPQSVNTLRIFTLRQRNGDVVIWHGSLRAGGGDSFVDNGFMGGIFADIDCRTGEVITNGFTERGEEYTHHPDSGLPLKGFVIPEWDDLVKTVLAMARHRSDVGYVGWDLALSEKGWVMVEGNSFGQIILTQTDTKIPFKQELLNIILA